VLQKGFAMLAEENIRKGNLPVALEDLQAQIRAKPDNSRYRIFYFQLLSVLGQWDRALSQLNVLEKLDRETWPMVQTYRSAIQCEVLRAEIFAGRQTPLIFGEPPPWMAWLVKALQLAAASRLTQAKELRDQAFDQAAPSSGAIDELPFQWIADADSRLGPVAEIIVNGRYYWAPFEQIRIIKISQPEDLRDLVWLPARFVWANGGEAVGLIPTRYSGSENSENSAIRLARTTQWQEVTEAVYHGRGQRMLATDCDDYPLLETRLITLDGAAGTE
jgi:type VI secretion system protein ImpE